MAGELVSFGVQKLWDLLHHEYEQFHGVKDKVTELKRDLNLLSSFLQDADKKRTRAVVRNCLEEIKEIIFDAEDIIETFLLKEEPGMTSGIQKHIKRLASIIPDRKEIALDIEGISKRISKVISDMQSFGVQQIIADSVYITQPVYDRQREMRETFSTDNERDLVGLEANIQALVGLMVEEDNVEVVSITGMGGVGKTTLARQVFNHKKVKDKFKQGLAWVCVSQEFSRISVWQTILRNLRPKEEEKKIMEMTESTLQGEIFKLLETSESLIVLDDIWKEEDWDRIKPIFPPKKDWKVLLTSRNERIAACGDMTYSNFKPECLTFQNSWTLFQRVAFPRKHVSESTVNKEMEEMGKQMVNHCGGLPLAIKVLGGLLAAKYTLHDWKRLSENIKSHIMGRNDFNDSNNSVFYVLSLSFEELPTYLKQCFLYLAHFPEDHEINVEKLAFYWAAEGIPKPRYYHGATIRDVANGYVEELMMRNMVIAEKDKSTLRPETFHLHDMMREVCLFKAEEDNFLQIVNLSSSTPNSLYARTSRRLVFQYPTTLSVETDITNPKVRSLLVITDNRCQLPGLSFKRLQLLRLLDLSRAKFEGGRLPSSIGKLIHLRYLSLEDAEVSHLPSSEVSYLPSSLENLKLLIYLNIDIQTFLTGICVPNILMGMQKLRYLALPKRMKNTKLELRTLVNLETLKNFSSEQSSLDDLRGMTGLRILTINSGSSSSETISSSIGVMRHLEILNLYGILSTRTPFVLVSDCNDLKILKLGINMPRLPDEQHFPQLTVIELNYCRLEEDPMPILEKLLHLHEVKLMTQSFCGRNMVCSTGGFPQLHRLEISGLFEWEDWKLEEGSMRHLHTLWLTGCKKLRRLPDRLRFITSLDVVMMRAMNGEWDDNYEKGGAGLHDFKHVPNFSYEGGPYGTDVYYNSD